MRSLFTFENTGLCLGQHEVLKAVSFVIRRGEPLALLGPSGCGKSTLLHLLAGLAAPSTGRILMEESLVSDAGRVLVAPHLRGIGMVFQDLALWPGLSAVQNVAAGIPSPRMSRHQRSTAASEMLRQCGLVGLNNRKPAQLSVGQQQRVALARALVSKPNLIVLDEPFTGLDLTVKKEIIAMVKTMARRAGATIVLVSHDPWEVESLCTRAVVLENGGVAEAGELARLLEAPESETLRTMASRTGI